jgi:hypothetical protein
MASKNNSDWPILPRFTVSALSNGTLVQIPVSPPSIAFYLNISDCWPGGEKKNERHFLSEIIGLHNKFYYEVTNQMKSKKGKV